MANELLTPGKGKFRVKRVKSHDDDGVQLETRKGDRKVMLVIEATDSKGNRDAIFEHLTMNIAWKVEAICKACDMHRLFESDATCLDKLDNLEGCIGECIIGHSEHTPEWPEKTIIARYIVPKVAKKVDSSIVDEFFTDIEDTIPF